MTRFVTTVKYDSKTGEYYLEFPPELLNQVGWDFGDTLIWKDNEDGSFSLEKKVGDSTRDQTSNEETHGALETTISRVPQDKDGNQ
jgi:hypothetical protein